MKIRNQRMKKAEITQLLLDFFLGGYVMSYGNLRTKIEMLPEEYLDEVEAYIEFVIFRHKKKK